MKPHLTSALAAFDAGLCRGQIRIWRMQVFVEGGKPENPEKNPQSKARTNNKLSMHMVQSRNRTQATLVALYHEKAFGWTRCILAGKRTPFSYIQPMKYRQTCDSFPAFWFITVVGTPGKQRLY